MGDIKLNAPSYIYSPLFLLLLIGGIIGIITFFFLLRYRKSPGVRYWLIWQIATSIWAFTYAFEFAGTDIETKILWSKFSYFGIVYSTVSYLFFSLEFSAQYRFLSRKMIIALYAVSTFFSFLPLQTIFTIFTGKAIQ